MRSLGFDFRDLFIFEMANNHQGSVEHGLNIVDGFGSLASREGVRAAMKFQMRELGSFIHPAHKKGSTNKHVGRFLSTRLTVTDMEKLISATRAAGMVTMCTPFDEPSVGAMVDLGFDVLKIGSPSARDWPLIETAADSGLPIIFSTGGLTLEHIDDLVSFFEHRKVDYAVLHCVSIYPTPTEDLQLGQIRFLRKRFPGTVIGYSGHEDPDDVLPVQIATGLGAEIFERHVGIPTEDSPLNAYSITPDQAERWIQAYKKARGAHGERVGHAAPTEAEENALLDLQRGVYAKRPLKSGASVLREDVFFAMPCLPGQLSSGEWREGITLEGDLERDGTVMKAAALIPEDPPYQLIYESLHAVRAMLNEAKVALPSEFGLEISHHYGMERFREVGVVLIDCVNRSYCKKILVQLPGQSHPLHYHKRKEETFQVLSGVLELEVEDRRKTLYPGDTLLVLPGVWHSFWTDTGVIFEEISTTHYNDDSFYADKAINKMERSDRKTTVKHWGRHQLAD